MGQLGLVWSLGCPERWGQSCPVISADYASPFALIFRSICAQRFGDFHDDLKISHRLAQARSAHRSIDPIGPGCCAAGKLYAQARASVIGAACSLYARARLRVGCLRRWGGTFAEVKLVGRCCAVGSLPGGDPAPHVLSTRAGVLHESSCAVCAPYARARMRAEPAEGGLSSSWGFWGLCFNNPHWGYYILGLWVSVCNPGLVSDGCGKPRVGVAGSGPTQCW